MYTRRLLYIGVALLIGIVTGICVDVVAGSRYHIFSPARPIKISFTTPGRLVFVEPVGATVAAGEVIARLDDSAFITALRQDETNIIVAKAKAAELQAVGKEQVLLSQKAAQEAATDQQKKILKDSRALSSVLLSLASTTQAAIVNVNPLFNNATSSNPELLIPVTTLSAAAVASGRIAVNANINNLVALSNTVSASSSPTDLLAAAKSATADVAEIQLFLESLSFLNEQVSTSTATSTTRFVAWQQGIAAARKIIDGAIYAIFSTQDALIYDEQSPVVSPTVVLDNHLTRHEVSVEKVIATAQASASSTAAVLAQLVVRAPVAGTIAAPAAPARLPHLGQMIVAGQSIVSLIPTP